MNIEQAQNTEQQAQARRRTEARRMAMAARISDIGRAENQSVSPEALALAHEEIARLQEQNENQEQTIRVQAETIARMQNTDINRLLSPKEPPLPPETANVPGEPVAVHTAPNVRRAGGE